MGEAAAAASLVLFSGNAFVVRAATRRLDQQLGFLVAIVVNVVVMAVLFGLLALSGGAPDRVDPVAVGLFAVSGVFAGYLGRRGYFRSVHTLGPSRAATIQNSNPVIALVLAWILLSQALGAVELLLVLVVTGGLVLTGLRPGRVPARRDPSVRIPLEVAVAVAAAAAYAVGNVGRGAAMDRWAEPVIGTLLGALAATAVYGSLTVRKRRVVPELRAADRTGIGLWCLGGTLTVLGQFGLVVAVGDIPVGVAVAIASATPALVLPASYLLLADRDGLDTRTVAGAVLVLAGVVLLLVMPYL